MGSAVESGVTPEAGARGEESGPERTGSTLGVTRREGPLAPPPPQTHPREATGRYVLIERIGRGGMGEVWAAYDPELDRKVAVKVLAAARGKLQSEYTARLLREAQAMARVRHPNVVAVHDVGTAASGEVYLAMEYVEGQTLGRWLEEQGRSWQEVLATLVAAGRGLAAAHACGVVHRDFKPENVMVDERGRAQVMDFGLAQTDAISSSETNEWIEGRELDGNVDRLTQTGTVMGTPAFMSPEQFRAAPPDERSDQFSFCVTAWRGLYRRRPFHGASSSELAAAVTGGRLQPAPTRCAVPARVRRALERGLSARSDGRWPSMEALLDELDAARVRRRRTATVLAGAGLAGTVAAGAWAAAGPEPCTGAKQEIERTYGPRQRQAVEQALLGTNAPYAAQTWTHVERSLDAYVQDWQQEYTETCEATRVRHEQSEAAMERRMACLGGTRMELRSVIEVLSDADVALLEGVQDVVADLTPPTACRHVDETKGAVPPPAPEDAATVEEIEELLARATTLLQAGRHEPAEHALQRAEQRLADTRYDPIVTRVRFAQGQLEFVHGRFEEAAVRFEEAQQNAVRWGQWDLVGRAAIELMTTAALHLGDPSRALAQGPTVRAVAERFVGSKLEADARHALGIAHRTLERLPEAEAALRKALALRIELHGPSHAAVAREYSELAVILVQLERVDEAIGMHERAISIFGDTLGRHHPTYFSAQAQLATALAWGGRPAEGVEQGRAATSNAEETLGPEHRTTATVRTTYSAILRRAGDLAEAQRQAGHAVATLVDVEGEHHRATMLARLELSEVLKARKRIAEAQEVVERALSVRRESVGELHPDIVRLKHTKMTFVSATGDYVGAQKLARQILDARISRLGSDDPTVATTRLTYAHYLTELGLFEEAREQLDAAVSTFERHLGVTAIKTLQARANRANILLHLREYEDAEPEYRTVSERYAEIYGPADSRTLRRRGALAMAIAEQGRHDEAKAIADEVLLLGAAPGHDRTEVGSARYTVGEVYAAAGRLDTAMDHYQGALEEFQVSLPDEHPVFSIINQRMGEVALRQGDEAAAVALLEPHWDKQTLPTELGRAAFVYARALWPANRREALEVARVAEDAFRQAGSRFTEDRREVSAWIRSRDR